VPILGLYGGNDARVNTTIPPAKAALKEAGAPYEPIVYEGAGHGFLRQQDGADGAADRGAHAGGHDSPGRPKMLDSP
jgi:carboxymethylenebutenolidase